MSSTHVSPLGSYRGSSPALDRRGWNLALGFQEVFTAIVRLRYNRQAVSDAESFRAQMKQALRVAEQEARSRGCNEGDREQDRRHCLECPAPLLSRASETTLFHQSTNEPVN